MASRASNGLKAQISTLTRGDAKAQKIGFLFCVPASLRLCVKIRLLSSHFNLNKLNDQLALSAPMSFGRGGAGLAFSGVF
jgi:hypothetical protein